MTGGTTTFLSRPSSSFLTSLHHDSPAAQRRRCGSIPALRLNCCCWLLGQGDGPVLYGLHRGLLDVRRAGRRRARCWDYFFGASGLRAAAMLATSWRLGIKSVSDAVCGRLKGYIDRWYRHLLVLLLIFPPHLFHHSLADLQPARPRVRVSLSRPLPLPMVRTATRLTGAVPCAVGEATKWISGGSSVVGGVAAGVLWLLAPVWAVDGALARGGVRSEPHELD